MPPSTTSTSPGAVELKVDYTPQAHQREWHESQTRFLVSVCGRQIGKTTAAVNEIFKRAVMKPNSRNWYVTNDYGQAKRNVWSEFKRYIPPQIKPVYNNSELTITLPTGSKIELIGVENADSLRGAVVDFMILDEYADFPRSVYPEVLRPMLSTTAGDVWFIGTPKGFNHFYELYEMAAASPDYTRFNVPSCAESGSQVVSTTSKYAKIGELQGAKDDLPDNSWRQEYLGEFNKPSGTVYSEWPVDNFADVPYDPSLPLHVAWDFGVNDPTVMVWIQPNGGEYRVIDSYEAGDTDIGHFVSVLNSKPYKAVELHAGDIAGNARNLTTGTSPIEELAKKGVHVRTKHIPNLPDQIRNAHKYIKGLMVDRARAERFRECMLNYRYPTKKETVINQINEVPIHDQYSHMMRAFEYWCANYGDLPAPGTQARTFSGGDSVTGYGGSWKKAGVRTF